MKKVFFFLTSLVTVVCSPQAADTVPSELPRPSKSIYLVSHGWHAGIVIKRADIPNGLWPQHNDFPEADFLEVGWGDEDYYTTPDPHFGIALKAGLLPTASVLHIVGFSGPVTDSFPRNKIIRVELSYVGFEELCHQIENSYARENGDLSQPLGRGLYGWSRFYRSAETYHAFNTCNAWTARALRTSGCPITPVAVLTVDDLMTQVATFGTVVQSGKVAPVGHDFPGPTDAANRCK